MDLGFWSWALQIITTLTKNNMTTWVHCFNLDCCTTLLNWVRCQIGYRELLDDVERHGCHDGFSVIHLGGRFQKLSTFHPTNWQVKSLTPNNTLDFVHRAIHLDHDISFIGQRTLKDVH